MYLLVTDKKKVKIIDNFGSYVMINNFGDYVKSVCIRRFSSPYSPAFGLNTEIYGVNLRIHSECWKIRTRKTLNTDHAAMDSIPYAENQSSFKCKIAQSNALIYYPLF